MFFNHSHILLWKRSFTWTIQYSFNKHFVILLFEITVPIFIACASCLNSMSRDKSLCPSSDLKQNQSGRTQSYPLSLTRFWKALEAVVPLPVPVCLFCKGGHCTGFVHVCSTSHGCSAPEIRTTSYQCVIKLRGTWEFFWPGSTGTFLISAVMWAESEVFLFSAGITSWQHLTLQSSQGGFVPWPLGPGQPQQVHQVLVRERSWNAKQQPPGQAESHHTQSGFNDFRMCGQKWRGCSRIIQMQKILLLKQISCRVSPGK